MKLKPINGDVMDICRYLHQDGGDSTDTFRFDLNAAPVDDGSGLDNTLLPPPPEYDSSGEAIAPEYTWTGTGVSTDIADTCDGGNGILCSAFMTNLLKAGTSIGQSLLSGNKSSNSAGSKVGGGSKTNSNSNPQSSQDNKPASILQNSNTLLIAGVIGGGLLLTITILFAVSIAKKK